jgi:hypothetical protein
LFSFGRRRRKKLLKGFAKLDAEALGTEVCTLLGFEVGEELDVEDDSVIWGAKVFLGIVILGCCLCVWKRKAANITFSNEH